MNKIIGSAKIQLKDRIYTKDVYLIDKKKIDKGLIRVLWKDSKDRMITSVIISENLISEK